MAWKIIICATQRCGSTMLLEDMRNAGTLGVPEEWFAPWSGAKEDFNYEEAFDRVIQSGTGENGVFSVKLMSNQLFQVDAGLRKVFHQTEGFAPNILKAFEDAVWVRLLRQDTLGQAISRVIAQQTNVYHATRERSDTHFAGGVVRGHNVSYADEAKYDFAVLLKQVQRIQLENIAWDQFFASYQIEPLVLVYEEIAQKTPEQVVKAIASYANIEASAQHDGRKLAKLAGTKADEWRQRFYEDLYARKFAV